MIYYGLLFLSFLITFYWLVFNKNSFYNVAINSVSLLDAMLSNEEENLKVKSIQKYTFLAFKSLAALLIILIIGLILVLIIPLLFSYYRGLNLKDLDWTSLNSILAICLGSSIPLFFPFQRKMNGYTELSKLLHILILDNYNIGLKLLSREVKKYSKNINNKNCFVIVSGLARSGTTSLTKSLHRTEAFSSLDYSNMPFLLAPNMWKKIYSPKKSELRERSHEDGILMGLDTIEALEEYFFKVIKKDNFIDEKFLQTHKISKSNYELYMKYQKIVRKNNSKIYLAKNNNFILRYKSMINYNQSFKMIVLFRHPLYHAASLLNQHFKTIQLQKSNKFAIKYMQWLAHHEFGMNHKPFNFKNDFKGYNFDLSSLNYWLEVWINYYNYILNILDEQIVLIKYEHYCLYPEKTIQLILNSIDIEYKPNELTGFVNNRIIDHEYSESLLDKALKIYSSLESLKDR